MSDEQIIDGVLRDLGSLVSFADDRAATWIRPCRRALYGRRDLQDTVVSDA
jgi:hypothetical protein